jgi:hypothetical protein
MVAAGIAASTENTGTHENYVPPPLVNLQAMFERGVPPKPQRDGDD